jgi:uncharacterized OB-fold protein
MDDKTKEKYKKAAEENDKAFHDFEQHRLHPPPRKTSGELTTCESCGKSFAPVHLRDHKCRTNEKTNFRK